LKLAAVFFDVTGTLIELAEAVGPTYARIAARHGIEVEPGRIGLAFERALEQAKPRLFPGLPRAQIPVAERGWWRERVVETFTDEDGALPFANFDAFFSELFDFYGRGGAWRLRGHALPALLAVRRLGLSSGVISNFDFRLPGVLQDLEIQGFMDAVLFPARSSLAKPSAKIFQAAQAELNLSASQCAYVGHHPTLDLASAQAAGWHALDINSGPASQSLSARIEGLARLHG
jgi:putative hydrolase of the HAD superfamily